MYSRKITSCETRVTSSSLSSVKVVTTSLRHAKESLASITGIRREVRLATRQDEKDKLARKYQVMHPELVDAVTKLENTVNTFERSHGIGACSRLGVLP
jgi:hypothetical protein